MTVIYIYTSNSTTFLTMPKVNNMSYFHSSPLTEKLHFLYKHTHKENIRSTTARKLFASRVEIVADTRSHKWH